MNENQVGTLTNAEAAAYVGISPKTLSDWRVRGEGPDYMRLGRNHARVKYRREDIDRWLADQVAKTMKATR